MSAGLEVRVPEVKEEVEQENLEIDEPSEHDFVSQMYEKPIRGILYERPKSRTLYTPLFLALVCGWVSWLFWYSQDISVLLWAGPEAIFGRHEYWRLFTALFAHADLKHLISNLPLFLIFGWLLRTYFGILAFPIASIAAGVFANYATIYFSSGPIRLIGASGMVYAMVAMWVVFYIRYEIRLSFTKKLLRGAGVLLVLLFPSSYSPTTSYLAHAFGFGSGIVIAVILILTGIYDRRQDALQNRS